MSQNIYVGVDWHKKTSTWVAINEQRELVYSKTWECTPRAVQEAIASLPASPEEIRLKNTLNGHFLIVRIGFSVTSY